MYTSPLFPSDYPTTKSISSLSYYSNHIDLSLILHLHICMLHASDSFSSHSNPEKLDGFLPNMNTYSSIKLEFFPLIFILMKHCHSLLSFRGACVRVELSTDKSDDGFLRKKREHKTNFTFFLNKKML